MALGQHNTSTAIPGLNRDIVYDQDVRIAPLPEQHRIVEAIEANFARLDEAVAGLERAWANLARYRDNVLKEACEGRLIFSRASTTTLGEIAEIQGGITLGKKRGQGERVRPVPYLRVANVQRGRLDLSEMKSIPATEEEIGRLRLVRGDVLFNEGGDRDKLGRGWIWEDQLPECIHQNHVFRARVNSCMAFSKFISYYGNSVAQGYFWDEGKHTTNMASINRTSLAALPIRLPPLQTQLDIVTEVERILSISDEASVEVRKSLDRANHLRKSILEAAYSGHLVRQEPSDEPASALLERIKAERSRSAPRRR
jgi:type I restriction enzyme S subunit